MFNFHLPLSNEEQAMLLLWHRIDPYCRCTVGETECIQAAIVEVIAACTRTAVEEYQAYLKEKAVFK